MASASAAPLPQRTLREAVFADLGKRLLSFPCWSSPDPRKNKTPKTPRGFKDAILSPWEPGPNELIGVPTGEASGISVLDIDPRHDGHIWLEANRDRLPLTRLHETQS